MVDLIFCSVVRRYSGCLRNPAVREHAASDNHVVKCTKVGQHVANFIFLPRPCLTMTFSYSLLSSNFGVQVSYEYCHVLLLQFVTQCLQFVVKVSCFFILVVCGCIALNDVELGVFFLCFE